MILLIYQSEEQIFVLDFVVHVNDHLIPVLQVVLNHVSREVERFNLVFWGDEEKRL